MTHVRNASYNKAFNRREILKNLRREPLSRAELSRKTGLTRAAISILTDELLAEGVIRESELRADPAVGRAPVLLTVVPERYYGVGVSVERERVEIGVSDFSGAIVKRRACKLKSTAEQTLIAAAKVAQALLHALSVPADRVLGVGVSAPGPLNDHTGVILSPPSFPGWQNVPVCDILRRETGLRTMLDNDANAMALYRYLQGASGSENFLFLLVDSGVGSGIVVGGRLLRAGEGFTTELGHTSIHYRGPRCACGGRGCLECYASIPAILARHPQFESWQALMRSDACDTAVRQEAEYLLTGVRNLRRIVSVDTLLLSGGIAESADRLIAEMERQLRSESAQYPSEPLRIVASPRLAGDRISAAANLVFSDFLGIA